MEGPKIETPRLLVTPLLVADAPAVLEYRSDPEVRRFQLFEPRTLEDAQAFIGDLGSREFDTPGTWFPFGIRRRSDGLLIGDLGTRFPADDRRQVEIGFTLAPAHQHHGYATEAVRGMLDYLLGPAGKHRVFASVDPRNGPSLALLARVGMRQEAHFRQSAWFKGEWVDDVVFGILASEWVGRASG